MGEISIGRWWDFSSAGIFLLSGAWVQARDSGVGPRMTVRELPTTCTVG